MIKRCVFIFFGDIYDKKLGSKLSEKEYDHILKLLSKMMNIYFYVETGENKYL